MALLIIGIALGFIYLLFTLLTTIIEGMVNEDYPKPVGILFLVCYVFAIIAIIKDAGWL